MGMSQAMARWLIVIGSVVGWVGFTVLGIGTSYVEAQDGLITLGAIATVAGVVALIAGGYAYRHAVEPGASTDITGQSHGRSPASAPVRPVARAETRTEASPTAAQRRSRGAGKRR